MQDGVTGSPWGDFAIKQGSAWLAFENELGVQEPVVMSLSLAQITSLVCFAVNVVSLWLDPSIYV